MNDHSQTDGFIEEQGSLLDNAQMNLGQEDESLEDTPLLSQITGSPSYGTPGSWSNRVGVHPYTEENKPKRLPFHPRQVRRVSSEQCSELYARYKYYQSLRVPLEAGDHALVIPDHIVPTSLFLPYIPGTTQPSDGKQGSPITIIAIWNTMMGTSLLTMPWAFGQAGFAGGIIIMVLMAGICLYTAYLILTLQDRIGLEGEPHEVAYLCRYLWRDSIGGMLEGLAVTFSVVTLIGALVVYWVLMSNFLYNTGEAIHGAIYSTSYNDGPVIEELLCPNNRSEAPGYNGRNLSLSLFEEGSDTGIFNSVWQQDLSVPLFLLIPFLVLVNIRNPQIFTYFNSLGAISVFVMLGFVTTKAVSWGFNFTITDEMDILYIPLFKNTFMALSGTLSLAYFIHNAVITIMKGNRHPMNNVRDLSIAYALVSLTYIPVGVIFYLTFPLPKYCVMDNFLDNFPPHNTILAIVRGFLMFQMMTVYPLLIHFVRSQLFSYLLGPNVAYSMIQSFITNFILLALCVLVAIFYPNIGFIIRWVGAMAGLAYIFVLPNAAYMKALQEKGLLTAGQATAHSLLIMLGIANFTAQFFLDS